VAEFITRLVVVMCPVQQVNYKLLVQEKVMLFVNLARRRLFLKLKEDLYIM